MKFFTLALAACMALTTPAWSLSCMRPDIIRTYEMARDSEAGFWIVHGQLFANQTIAIPQPDAQGRFKENAQASTPAAFKGFGLGTDGIYAEFSHDIDVTILCFAHWCGSAPTGQHIFAAIEVKDTGPELVLDPCNSRVVPYSEEANERLLNCLRNGTCLAE